MKTIKINLFFLTCFLVFQQYAVAHKIDDNYVQYCDLKILIRGPGSCAQMIVFNGVTGIGYVIRGLTDDYYRNEFVKFRDTEIVARFRVQAKDDLIFTKKIITEFKDSTIKIKGLIRDARREQIYINGVLKLDSYGFENEPLEQVFYRLMYYIPYDVNHTCGQPFANK